MRARFSTTAAIGYSSGAASNVVMYRSLTYGTALPNPFGPAMSYSGQTFNYWLVVQ